MSLDGFVAGPNDSPEQPLGEGGESLFAWYSSGDTVYTFPSGTFTVQISQASADLLQAALSTAGVLVSGRRTFDITNGWNGRHPMDVPVLVVTHSIPEDWVKEFGGDGSTVTFVTDGFERAMERARAIAGDKDVIAGSPSIAQQCIRAGLLDEIQVDLVPIVLGDGIRLFANLGDEPLELEITRVVEGIGVTHITYQVVK
jgi:dihydrofolate reductase